jgi:demethylmenaquinone methyltransferase/2-methoxy-6-polyprenyl-1,4-benzoquinol methylase
VSFREGDVRKLPFEDDSFDWTWSVDCIGYAPLEPLPLIKELKRVVRPGGVLAIMAWSSETLLPGYPYLESMLRMTDRGLAPFTRGSKPENHFLRAMGWFREAGLQDLAVHSFAGTVHAPLDERTREAMVSLFDMRWGGVEGELERDKLGTYRRFCLPDSHDFLPDHPDYVGFFTYTMFWGQVPN